MTACALAVFLLRSRIFLLIEAAKTNSEREKYSRYRLGKYVGEKESAISRGDARAMNFLRERERKKITGTAKLLKQGVSAVVIVVT